MIRTKIQAVVLRVIILAPVSFAHGAPFDYKGHKVVRGDVQSRADLNVLNDLSVTILNCHIGIMPLDAIIPPERMEALEQSGLSYRIIDGDLEEAATRHLNRPATRGAFDDYMNLDEIVSFINNLAATRPDLCEIFSMGTSLEGRDMWVLQCSTSQGVALLRTRTG